MKRSIITIIALFALLVSWSDALASTPRPVQPGTPYAHLALPLRHAVRAPDRGRTHLLRCVKLNNC